MSADEVSLQIMSWAQNQLSLWQNTARDQQISKITLEITIPATGMKQYDVSVQYQNSGTSNASNAAE